MGEAETGLDENERKDEQREKKKRMTGELSRSASPSIHTPVYPVSVRQQMALIRQMSQPSPSGSTDGESLTNTTPTASRKRVPRVHKKNNRGETPLHVAARRGDGAKCFDLIREGADVNCADYAGWTALHEACNHNHFDTAEILLKNGADVNRASADGETPLHDAAASRNAKLVWLLLMYGADREIRNNQNKRPADIANQPSTAYNLLTSNELPSECPSETSTPSPVPAPAEVPPDPSENQPTTSTQENVPVDVPLTVSIEPEPITLFNSSSAPTTQVLAAEPEEFSRAVSMAFATISNSPETVSFNAEQEVEEPVKPQETESSNVDFSEESGDTPPEDPGESEVLDDKSQNWSQGKGNFPKTREKQGIGDGKESFPNSANISPRESSPSNTRPTSPVDQVRVAIYRSLHPKYAALSNDASPVNTFEFIDDMDESSFDRNDALGKKRGLRPGRSSRGRNSGSSTPTMSTSSERKARSSTGRGRGGRRGRGVGNSKTLDSIEESGQSNPMDVYDFRGSPDSDENMDYQDEKEKSLPPASKRFRFTEPEIESTRSTPATEDVDDDDDERTNQSTSSARKVPPLRISLTKTPSEEDQTPDEIAIGLRSKTTTSRGRPIRKPNEAEDAQRLTRSKVRQTGRPLDEVDHWAKKKRGRPAVAEVVRDEIVDEMIADTMERDSSEPSPMVEYSNAGKVLTINPLRGMYLMKKFLTERWWKDSKEDLSRNQQFSLDKYKNFSLFKADYQLSGSNSPKGDSLEKDTKVPSSCPSILVEFWEKQEKERQDLLNAIEVEQIRLKLFFEQEFIRMERRREGTAPIMSAIRIIRESQICNPQILDQPTMGYRIIEHDQFVKKIGRRLSILNYRHRMEVDSLFEHQKTLFEKEAVTLNVPLTLDTLNECVPVASLDEFKISFS